MKKKCLDCEKNRTGDSEAPKTIRRREPDINRLIARYGIIGVMRMSRVYFEELINQENPSDAHRTVFVLLSNFERILRNKLELKAPSEVEQTKQSLRELGVKY